MPTWAVFAGTRLRSSVIKRLEGQAVSRCAALLVMVTLPTTRASASSKFLPVNSAIGVAGLKLARSRSRLFGDEASDIASELIAMTLLQQQKRVNRAAKKTVAHQGKDNSVKWHVD